MWALVIVTSLLRLVTAMSAFGEFSEALSGSEDDAAVFSHLEATIDSLATAHIIGTLQSEVPPFQWTPTEQSTNLQ